MFAAFRSHMTLTGRLGPEDRATALPLLTEAAAGLPDLRDRCLSVVVQEGAEPFRVLRRLPFSA